MVSHKPGAALTRVASMLIAGLLLQGCVAAAIPVLAGGAIASREVANGDRDDGMAVQAGAAPEAQPEAPQDTAQDVATSATEAATDPSADSVEEITETPQVSAVPAAPSVSAKPGLTAIGPRKASSDYADFASYALAQSGLQSDQASSALLQNPGALDGVRAQCSAAKLAVLIDLDPAGGTIALDSYLEYDPGFVAQLETLRSQGLTIGWISQRLTLDAERVRSMLLESSLDQLGQDVLLLLPSFDQNKQQLRREFSQDYCLVAIAGDTFSDFDELFDYLKNPDAALRLNLLRNAGWFITPLPLTPAPQTTKE
jgi:hypothetical protein